jgi:hypothetical protein
MSLKTHCNIIYLFFIVCLTMLQGTQTLCYKMMGLLLNNEFERIWKAGLITKSRYYTGICLKCLRKTMKASVRISCVQAEIRTRHHLNTC